MTELAFFDEVVSGDLFSKINGLRGGPSGTALFAAFRFCVRWIFAFEQTSQNGFLREMSHHVLPGLGLFYSTFRSGATDNFGVGREDSPLPTWIFR